MSAVLLVILRCIFFLEYLHLLILLKFFFFSWLNLISCIIKICFARQYSILATCKRSGYLPVGDTLLSGCFLCLPALCIAIYFRKLTNMLHLFDPEEKGWHMEWAWQLSWCSRKIYWREWTWRIGETPHLPGKILS